MGFNSRVQIAHISIQSRKPGAGSPGIRLRNEISSQRIISAPRPERNLQGFRHRHARNQASKYFLLETPSSQPPPQNSCPTRPPLNRPFHSLIELVCQLLGGIPPPCWLGGTCWDGGGCHICCIDGCCMYCMGGRCC